MRKKVFSIIEISVVIFVILLLMSLAAGFYKTVQRSIMNKNQMLEFDNIKLGINSYKAGIRKVKPGNTKHITIHDLIYVHNLLVEKRILIPSDINGKPDLDANILSYFDTPIEVYVTKKWIGASDSDIEADLKPIPGFKYLTGDFKFYFGKDHEIDGGEMGVGPNATKYGLIGSGVKDDANQYHYKFVYYENEAKEGVKHEYFMH
jgi:hypothetical protein